MAGTVAKHISQFLSILSRNLQKKETYLHEKSYHPLVGHFNSCVDCKWLRSNRPHSNKLQEQKKKKTNYNMKMGHCVLRFELKYRQTDIIFKY